MISAEEEAQLMELIQEALRLSEARANEQTITLVFRHGHLSYLNASNNYAAKHRREE